MEEAAVPIIHSIDFLPPPDTAAPVPSDGIRMFTQATIKDVARAAGVHFTTVSMALRGHPAVAKRTRQQIEAVAKQIGYQRNAMFASLSRQRKDSVFPSVIPSLLYLGRARNDRHFFAMPHHQQMVAGATREAKALGYQLTVKLVGPTGIKPENLSAYLARSPAAGVVIGAWDATLAVPVVDWTRMPTIKIDSSHVPAKVPFVSNDQMKGVLHAFRQLHARGYRRIGLATGEKDEDATDGMHVSGWLTAHHEYPRLRKIPILFFPPGINFPTTTRLINAWRDAHHLDAIISNWGSIPLILQQHPRPARQATGFVGLCCDLHEPQITGIVPNLDLVGQRAVSLLGSIINAPTDLNPTTPLISYVEGTWHDGSSIQRKK